MLPATADVIAVVHRSRGGRSRRALDDRQCHALPADAVRSGGASTASSSCSALMAYAGAARRRRARAGAVPRAGDAGRRHGPPDALSRDLPARGRVVPPASPSPGRCSSTASTSPWRRRSSSTSRRRTRRCAPPSCESSAGRWRACPADATAFAHRDSKILVNVATFYTGPDDRERRAAWVEGLSAALHQDDDGAYVNFLADEGTERIRAAYPGDTWDRLAAVKGRYDPDDLFRLNQNIPPAFDGASEVDA